ncbi:MAG: secondary thiamine-phosphate synthase enzyme YjbQ, partial [Chloroflexi bacterium]|nr:secondary thiamine-phosphate synthase enzyme YjbQ [Chloroflexota bacterium]
MLKTITIETPAGDALVDITAEAKALVAQSGVQAGICALIVPHTTAAITLNSGLDPATPADIVAELKRLVPTRVDFIHQYDTPADAAAHIKAALVGNSI